MVIIIYKKEGIGTKYGLRRGWIAKEWAEQIHVCLILSI